MKLTFFILFILLSNKFFSQEIDTTFVIKTKQSEISISAKKQMAKDISSCSSFMGVKFNLNQDVKNEALNFGLLSGKAYIEVEYEENCNIKSMKMVKDSKNISFNNQLKVYFNEFILTYNSNHFKNFLGICDEECGPKIIIFSYSLN